MNWWQAALLGVIQGLTEFLPVSSDGHLALAGAFLTNGSFGVQFAVLLHVGTLLAVVLAFPKGLAELFRGVLRLPRAIFRPRSTWDHAERFAWNAILSAIPAAILGFALRDRVDATYDRLDIVGGGLLVTAAMLWSTVRAKRNPGTRDLTWKDALLIGLAQALALLPGVSRSGMTIATALMLRVERGVAAEFSFVASAPLIFGAALLESEELWRHGGIDPGPVIVGIATAFVLGWLALSWLVKIVRAGTFHRFAPYCAVLGVAAILAQYLRR